MLVAETKTRTWVIPNSTLAFFPSMSTVPNSEFRPFKFMHKPLCGVVSALKLPNMTDCTVNKSGHFPSVTSKRMN